MGGNRLHIKPKTEPKKKREIKVDKSIQAVLGGTFLTRETVIRHLPYIFLLTILAFIYITNIYYAEKTQRDIDDTTQELKELRWESVSAKSKLEFMSKQSEVAKKLEGTGVIESTIPPQKIIIPKTKDR